MTFSLPLELPDNLPACHALIRRQAEVIEELKARIEEQDAQIDRLNRDLAALKRHVFGSRRERFMAGVGEDLAGEEAVGEGRRGGGWERMVGGNACLRVTTDVQGPAETGPRSVDSS